EPAEPSHVLDHIARLAGEAIRRRAWQPERNVVSTGSADLDGVNAEDAGSIRGRQRRACAVAVIRQDDELEPGARRGGGDFIGGAGAVRGGGVDVIGAVKDGWRRENDRVTVGRTRGNAYARPRWQRQREECEQREEEAERDEAD